MTGTFGWTIKVDWKNQTRGMNHKKARRIQEMADLKMKDVKQTKKKRSRWGIKISPLKPLIGRGARSIDHHFNNSPTVKRVKQHIETPKERKQRFEKLRKKPRQHIDDESRASNHVCFIFFFLFSLFFFPHKYTSHFVCLFVCLFLSFFLSLSLTLSHITGSIPQKKNE